VRSQKNPHPTATVIGLVLLLVGAGLIALSLLADWLDIGGGAGFGYQQLIVLIVGIALVLGGIRMVAQSLVSRPRGPADIGNGRRA